MHAQPIKLRSATVTDCASIWGWANDLATRQASLQSDPITWEEHLVWLAAKLANPQTRYYLGLDQDQPIGEIRFDLDGQEAVVSVTLAPARRRQGYAATLINLGVERLMAETAADVVYAFVKPDNVASAKAFLKAGFQECEAVVLREQPVRRFLLERNTNLDSAGNR